jgi:hypothetical protein
MRKHSNFGNKTLPGGRTTHIRLILWFECGARVAGSKSQLSGRGPLTEMSPLVFQPSGFVINLIAEGIRALVTKLKIPIHETASGKLQHSPSHAGLCISLSTIFHRQYARVKKA